MQTEIKKNELHKILAVEADKKAAEYKANGNNRISIMWAQTAAAEWCLHRAFAKFDR